MSKNNDVVIIELDRPRELRFGHKALKTMEALGIDVTGMQDGNFKVSDIEKIIYCGLLSEVRRTGENLKLEDMEDLLDQAPSYQHVIEKMEEALSAAFGGGDAEGNAPNPAQSRKSGTGSKV